MFTNIGFAAFVAAVIASAPLLAAQNNGTDATVTPKVENAPALGSTPIFDASKADCQAQHI